MDVTNSIESITALADKLKAEGNKKEADRLYRELKKIRRQLNESEDKKTKS